MNQNELVQHIYVHMCEHHPSLQGDYNPIFINDPVAYAQLIDLVEANDEHVDYYVEELERLELLFDYYMNDALKNVFLRTLDDVFEHFGCHYQSLVHYVVSTRAFGVSFVVLGSEERIARVTKIIYDVRSKVFHIEDLYAA